jgi:hypothetical protein
LICESFCKNDYTKQHRLRYKTAQIAVQNDWN